jgi:hypothetical protein
MRLETLRAPYQPGPWILDIVGGAFFSTVDL